MIPSIPERDLGARVSEAVILLITFGLCLLGLIALYSIGRAPGNRSTELLNKQLLWMVISLGAMWVTTRLRFDRLREFVWIIGGFSLLLLILVLIPGIGLKVNGARRWIDLGVMNMQVSDFAKIGFLFVFAHYLAINARRQTSFIFGYLIPCGIIGTVCGLVILQPDFGTAALFGTVGGLMLFLSGARLLYLIVSGLSAMSLFAIMVMLDPVRLDRVVSFMDLEGTKSDGGYQLWQGIIGFGVGGVQGIGIGNGRQALSFLPEAHTDFIFAVIGEELGMFCTVGVVLAFIVFFVVVLLQLRKAPNVYEFLLVVGALGFILIQAIVNFGVVTGLLPTKGMSLPFISYGGSNLLAMGIFVGIILNCIREWSLGLRTRAREIDN